MKYAIGQIERPPLLPFIEPLADVVINAKVNELVRSMNSLLYVHNNALIYSYGEDKKIFHCPDCDARKYTLEEAVECHFRHEKEKEDYT